MRGAVLHAPGDVRLEQLDDATIVEPTDAVLRISATCVCGSDLWPYRGANEVSGPTPIGHEYCGIVEAVGAEVTSVRPGQFVIGSFVASDNTCPHCRAGYQTQCQHRVPMQGCQAGLLRGPLGDGTLGATPDGPAPALLPSMLPLPDVMGTGWFAAVAAGVQPGMTVAVVGGGAGGLCGVLSSGRARGVWGACCRGCSVLPTGQSG